MHVRYDTIGETEEQSTYTYFWFGVLIATAFATLIKLASLFMLQVITML